MHEDYVDCTIRDHFDSGNVLKVKSMPYSKFKQKLDEYERSKHSHGKKKCAHWLLHNFENLKADTKCKDCGMTVSAVRAERGIK